MDALILSCSTGGGHNAAGKAIKEELENRGHHVDMFDPYDLVNKDLGSFIGNVYIKLVQKFPRLFGMVYFAGDIVRILPFRSPVYWANMRSAHKMRQYLNNHKYDAIIMPHIYPAEMLTILKRHFKKLPPTFFVATDYVCIPFTEESDLDYYFIPGQEHMTNFMDRGIPEDKLIPFGIPVCSDYDKVQTPKRKSAAKARLNLNPNKKYILVVGGSVGAGNLQKTLHVLSMYIKTYNELIGQGQKPLSLIVVCGNNQEMYRQLRQHYGNTYKILQSTKHMADYMMASEMLISKPGGLSSTEAATMQVPLIHVSPIPGCESHNARFFNEVGASIYAKNLWKDLIPSVRKLLNPKNQKAMRVSQSKYINHNARNEICDFIEKKCQ